MALLLILDTDGKGHLVHSSIFDQFRKPRLLGEWGQVWGRFDGERAAAARTQDPRRALPRVD